MTDQAGDSSLTLGELAVVKNVLTHADSSVSDISSRTGFVQSHVSVSVARLVQRGLVETFTDPTDGCRTRVRFRVVAVRAVTARAGRDVHDVLAAAGIDVDRARRVGGILSIEVPL